MHVPGGTFGSIAVWCTGGGGREAGEGEGALLAGGTLRWDPTRERLDGNVRLNRGGVARQAASVRKLGDPAVAPPWRCSYF